jgi:hypothetical protein
MKTKVLEILAAMQLFVREGLNHRSTYLTDVKRFTRHRKLDFERLCLFMLANCKRSLGLELDLFFLEHGEWPCSKSAFSQARYGVKSDFFRAWSQQLIDLTYRLLAPRLRTWKHFYLKGVDGTTLYLFEQADVVAEFGGSSNQFGLVVLGRAGFQVDLLNGYCCAAYLGPHPLGEPHFAASFLANATPADLLIYDRNFISFELIYKHLQAGVPFLMRAMITFNKTVEGFVHSGAKQAIERFPIPDEARYALTRQGYTVDAATSVTVRLLRIELDNGTVEVLVSSLLDRKKYSHACFKDLYGKRWGCETYIDKVKNQVQLEIFTGHKPQAIYQDFFATMILLNLHTLIVASCHKGLRQLNERRVQPAAINQNISIGLLKQHLIELFGGHSPALILQQLKGLFLSHLEQVRPGRKYPREPTRKKRRGKYQTLPNYRRAF